MHFERQPSSDIVSVYFGDKTENIEDYINSTYRDHFLSTASKSDTDFSEVIHWNFE